MIKIVNRIFFATCCVTLLFVSFMPSLRADAWNKKTILTFRQPVEVPGMVLPAGTYVFKLLDSTSDRNIVQVFNADETHLYGTFLAIPDYRLQPTDKTVLTFEERAANAPEAVKAWFYPGDLYGQEFVYPKVKAIELAQANKQPVLSMPSEMAAHITKPVKTGKESHVAALKQAPVKAVTPEKKEIAIANVVTTQPPAASSAGTTAKASKAPKQYAMHHHKTKGHLPKTAGELPLLALIGLFSLGAASALRFVSNRIH